MKILEAISIYKELDKAIPEMVQPPKVLLTLIRNKNKCHKVIGEYEAARLILINKYGKKDDNGELVVKDNCYDIEDVEGYNNEYRELIEQDANIELDKFNIEDMNTSCIEGTVMELLEPMID